MRLNLIDCGYVSIQSCKFNWCAKFEYRIKPLPTKHCFQPVSRRESPLPDKLVLNITKKNGSCCSRKNFPI